MKISSQGNPTACANFPLIAFDETAKTMLFSTQNIPEDLERLSDSVKGYVNNVTLTINGLQNNSKLFLILKKIKDLKQITSLAIRDTRLNSEALEMLISAEVLLKDRLQGLKLKNSSPFSSSLERLLHSFVNLTSLEMPQASLKDKDIKKIMSGLSHTKVSKINFSTNEITDCGFFWIMKWLEEPTRASEISIKINNNDIFSVSLMYLKKCLDSSSSILNFNISGGNLIYPEDILFLLESHKIKSLDIRNCPEMEEKDFATTVIKDALKSGTKLLKLTINEGQVKYLLMRLPELEKIINEINSQSTSQIEKVQENTQDNAHLDVYIEWLDGKKPDLIPTEKLKKMGINIVEKSKKILIHESKQDPFESLKEEIRKGNLGPELFEKCSHLPQNDENQVRKKAQILEFLNAMDIKQKIEVSKEIDQPLLDRVLKLPDRIINEVHSSLIDLFFKDIIKKEYELLRVPADGNCLFYSIAILLENSLDSAQRWRTEAVEYIRTHKEDFVDFIEVDINNYCENMLKPQTWVDDCILSAVVKLFRKKNINYSIKIFDRHFAPKIEAATLVTPELLIRGETDEFIYLLRENQNHYSPLIPKNDAKNKKRKISEYS